MAKDAEVATLPAVWKCGRMPFAILGWRGPGITSSLVPQMELLLGKRRRQIMGFGRGAILWLLGVPLPIILLLALFWHH
jgi:hypothetical protein